MVRSHRLGSKCILTCYKDTEHKISINENRNLLDDTQIKVVDETLKKKDNEKSILDDQACQLNEKTSTVSHILF